MQGNANIDTYVSAKWNIEICKSGESGIEYSRFPFGNEMKPNKILDIWLESMIELVSPGNSNTQTIGGGLVFSKLTDGYIHLGTGTMPIKNSDTSLHKFYKKTNYIRPNFNRATGIYVSGSGMAIFSRTYDFPTETQKVIYTEAGFEPTASSLVSNSSRRGKIWSRFIFTRDFFATGFLSGYIDNNGNFQTNEHPIDYGSGIIVSGKLYNIPPIKTKKYEPIIGYRSGFLDQFGNFTFYSQNNPQFKHDYLSGYYISGEKFPINDRYVSSQTITGFLSGFQDEYGNFSGFNNSENASSGYFLNGLQNFFPTGENFSGFSGENDFDNYLGFQYNGFSYQSGSGFSGATFATSGTGVLTGILGYRNIYVNIPFSGFTGLSGFDNRLGFQFSGFNFSTYTVQTVSGNFGLSLATGLIGYRYILESSGSETQGFDNIPLFEYGWRYNPSGRMFNGLYNSGFIYNSEIRTQTVVGFRSGATNEFGVFIPFTTNIPGSQGFSGYILSGKKYYFPTGSTFSGFSGMPGFYNNLGFLYSGFFPNQSGFSGESWPKINFEKINGFISGFKDDLGQFYGFQDLYPELRSSGYFLNGQQYYFPTGNTFSGFNGMPGFSSQTGFAYTGFSFPEGYLFSGITGDAGTGILSGYIGHKVFFTYPNSNMTGSFTGIIGSRQDYFQSSNSGIMTGVFGFGKMLSGIELTTGEFVKLKYETAIRIPAMINPIPVTGSDIVYGDFNGSGSIKLVGNYSRIFGGISSDGVSNVGGGNGFWWPAHNKWFSTNLVNPNVFLSAILMGPDPNGNFFTGQPAPFPAENNTNFMFPVEMEDDVAYALVLGKYPNGTDYYGLKYWSNTSQSQSSSFPLYEFGTIIPNYAQSGTFYPKDIKYTFIFKAEYPNRDEDIGGFFFAPSSKTYIDKTIQWQPLKPYVFNDYIASFQGVNVPYVGWYYRFDNYQTKYEDQIINLDVTFSVNRENYV